MARRHADIVVYALVAAFLACVPVAWIVMGVTP